LVAALIAAKFLIAASFEQHRTFPTIAFRKVKVHMNQTAFEGLMIYRAVSRGRIYFHDPKKSSFNSVKYAVKEGFGSKVCNAAKKSAFKSNLSAFYQYKGRQLENMRQLKIAKQVTNRETASLDKYLQEIGRVDLITADEEVELARKIKAGDRVALERLTKANLRFVVSVAKQYQNQGLALPDLINEGNLGLIKAAERFDETRGFKFISYAVWWIRQSILQALAEQARIVRLPLNKIGNINKINRAYSELEQKFERPPSADELAEFLNVTPEEVKQTLSQNGRHISMDAPLIEGDDSTSTMYDVMQGDSLPGPEASLTLESLRSDIRRSLTSLTPRESEVISMFYGLDGKAPLSLEEIGDKFELTRERVRQIKEKAIRRLKHTNKNKVLKSYLG
jgi:RNA polymerase primary sigma factor